MVDLVQSAKPLTYAVMHEGLLVSDEARQMIARSQRGQPFRQVMLSAEARARVELWREYTPPEDVTFWVSYRDQPGWFLGDTAGNLHYSYDGLTWVIDKRFDTEIKGVFYDGMEEPWLWVCTDGGEIWRGGQSEVGGAWTWELSYADPTVRFVGVGMSDRNLVGFIYGSKNIVRSTDLDGGPWSMVEVFPSVYYGFSCFSEKGLSELWYANYRAQPWYTTDGGATWTETPAAAGNAIAEIGVQNGTVIATGPGGAWRTTDYGVTWTEVIDTTPGSMSGICAGPSGWVAVSGAGDIYVSYDDGITWAINGSRADNESGWNAGVSVALNYENTDDQMMAVFGGSAMISMDAGATWTAGAGGEAWRISVDEYQPVLLDLPYEVPANERLVGKASDETFVLVGG